MCAFIVSYDLNEEHSEMKKKKREQIVKSEIKCDSTGSQVEKNKRERER